MIVPRRPAGYNRGECRRFTIPFFRPAGISVSETTLWSLVAFAPSTGVIHTLAGPDHYIPFIAMAKAGKWSTLKTFVVTVLCGFGHVMSSVVPGLIGVAIGIALARLEAFESFRGDIAGWLLLGFGVAYLCGEGMRHKGWEN